MLNRRSRLGFQPESNAGSRARWRVFLHIPLAIATACPHAACGDSGSPQGDALRRLLNASAAISSDNPRATFALSNAIDQLGSTTVELDQAIGKTPLSRSYQASLEADVRALARADAALRLHGGIRTQDLVEAVTADLRAKIDSARMSAGFVSGAAGVLHVSVYIQKAGHPASGLLVRANYFLDKDADPPELFFDTLSSSATADLAPGKYNIIVRTSDEAPPLMTQFKTVTGAEDAHVRVDLTIQ